MFVMVLLGLFTAKKYFTGSYFYAFFYGCMIQAIGFAMMHDASHGALSKNSWINTIPSVIWNSWAQWSHWVWLQHHTYAHHSYTNIYLKDPDLVHFSIFIKKLIRQRMFGSISFNIYIGGLLYSYSHHNTMVKHLHIILEI